MKLFPKGSGDRSGGGSGAHQGGDVGGGSGQTTRKRDKLKRIFKKSQGHGHGHGNEGAGGGAARGSSDEQSKEQLPGVAVNNAPTSSVGNMPEPQEGGVPPHATPTPVTHGDIGDAVKRGSGSGQCRPMAQSSTADVVAAHTHGAESRDQIYEDHDLVRSYESIPMLEQVDLPRGGVSISTEAVGRVQFGIPPETIKDSMNKGLDVPSVYIVPVERFCRKMGPALGVNLAEFEFPAYFNFFVRQKRCTLIVDSDDAEHNIRKVFSETLLGPEQFRREKNCIPNEDEDFDSEFPVDKRPNFEREFRHFRIMPDGKELVLETLLKFRHFEGPGEGGVHEGLGVPPPPPPENNTLDESKQEKTVKRSSTTTILDDAEPKPIPKSASSPAMAVSGDDAEESVLAEEQKRPWTYSQAKWIGDVATVFPENASPEEIESGKTKRVEIFKLPGGMKYILHDINENNVIVGKTHFSGNVEVHELMSVDGFGGKNYMELINRRESTGSVSRSSFSSSRRSEETGGVVGSDDDMSSSDDDEEEDDMFFESEGIKTFHPPSFGVTVLGNSHGFDKSGSTSGYVLWINGRGVMIDPPPYSSATLEREGIRPGTIVGIILTHCHADHDAGAFQKILTGSPVAVITTPTIYKSFIRKYAALSALSPSLLRHSHRHVPAIIGAPLRFQGATFHFTYTLHTIPCVGFRVEWRGRSMVFTGDHFNSPPAILKLEETGVLSSARAADLRQFPIQETDLLLHEAGAPPIHTPLEALKNLEPHVKKRLLVVHTSALPEDCGLKVAPTGTEGTISLDELRLPTGEKKGLTDRSTQSIPEDRELDEVVQFLAADEYGHEGSGKDLFTSFTSLNSGGGNRGRKSSQLSRMSFVGNNKQPPLVSLRPASSTDAWFILNLLSAVPFLSSLSYASTMEVLESARVDAYCVNDIVVPTYRRGEVLCVVWEGTCMEREHIRETFNQGLLANGRSQTSAGRQFNTSILQLNQGKHKPPTLQDLNPKKRVGVWQAGDWTGPRSLQPEKRLSGESSASKTHDIVAMSKQGVKVITVEFTKLHAILKSGSTLYRKYLVRRSRRGRDNAIIPDSLHSATSRKMMQNAVNNLNMIELIECNPSLRKLSAVQKRHIESLAEGPIYYSSNQPLWQIGEPVDKAFIIIAGFASFSQRGCHDGDDAKHVNGQDNEHPDSTGERFNKVMGMVHSRRAITNKVILSRGNFLGDISKMVAGLLVNEGDDALNYDNDSGAKYGSANDGDMIEYPSEQSVIKERSAEHFHTSTLVARKDGCVVMCFPKTTLTAFLDKYPGFLLSLLGVEVVL